MMTRFNRSWFLAAVFACASLAAEAGSLPDEKARLSADAFASMAGTLGLRESASPSRDHPGWEKPEKVVVWMLDGWNVEELQAVAPGVEIVGVDSREAVETAIVGAQAMIGTCSSRS